MQLAILSLLMGYAVASRFGPLANKEFLDGYQKFTGDVYTELSKSNQGNFIASPLSVDIILALAEYGSKGETSKQLMKGLSLPEDKEKLREAISSITSNLHVDQTYVLTSANKIYVKDGYKLLEDFKKFAVDVYKSEVENIDFDKKESAANEMNKWVEKKTFNKIKDLVDQKELDEDTRSVFINALYFHADWAVKFEKAKTTSGNFYLDKSAKTEAAFMDATHKYNYLESPELKAKFLEIPYIGKDVTMTIVLPNEKDGLASLQDKISQVLSEPRLKYESVHIKIPKFKIETKVEFVSILKSLGIVNAFDDRAEFTKITTEPLKISQVVQKAVIEVDEDGTIAAAATVVYLPERTSAFLTQEQKEFFAEHPFIFYLKYRSVVLFIGHYTGK